MRPVRSFMLPVIALFLAAGCSAPDDTKDLTGQSDWVTSVHEQVAEWYDVGEVVGAELLVIKDSDTVIHEVWGWADREDERALELDMIFRIRSMTKPLIGTAPDEERLERLRDPAVRSAAVQLLPLLANGATIERLARSLAAPGLDFEDEATQKLTRRRYIHDQLDAYVQGLRKDVQLSTLIGVAGDVAEYFGREMPGCVYKAGAIPEKEAAGPASFFAAATRSSLRADRQRENTDSPMRVTGTPSSSAEMPVHFPVPFCPAVSRIRSTTGCRCAAASAAKRTMALARPPDSSKDTMVPRISP